MTTEAEVLSNIIEWSANIPAWQRDALRRLSTRETLKQDDINELISPSGRIVVASSDSLL